MDIVELMKRLITVSPKNLHKEVYLWDDETHSYIDRFKILPAFQDDGIIYTDKEAYLENKIMYCKYFQDKNATCRKGYNEGNKAVCFLSDKCPENLFKSWEENCVVIKSDL